jgi:hypothetical protein
MNPDKPDGGSAREPRQRVVVDIVIATIRGELLRIVAALLGDRDTRGRRESAANFIYGMCVFHAFGSPVLTRLGQPPPGSGREVKRLLKQLFTFALGGVRAL